MKSLDELNKAWQSYDHKPMALENLSPKLVLKKHPTLIRTRFKLWIEGVMVLLFLLFYYTALDGAQKPLLFNVLLVISLLFYLVVHATSLVGLSHMASHQSLQITLKATLVSLKKLKRLNVLSVAFFAASFMAYSIDNVSLTGTKLWILLGMTITFMAMMVMVMLLWNQKIKQIQSHINELES